MRVWTCIHFLVFSFVCFVLHVCVYHILYCLMFLFVGGGTAFFDVNGEYPRVVDE